MNTIKRIHINPQSKGSLNGKVFEAEFRTAAGWIITKSSGMAPTSMIEAPFFFPTFGIPNGCSPTRWAT